MNCMRTSLFTAICMSLSLSATAAESDPAERCLVSFSGAQQDVCSGKISSVASSLHALGDLEAVRDSDLRLIKFDGPIHAEQRAAVEAIGAKIVDYAPHYAYIVRMPVEDDAQARAIPGVIWSGPLLPAFKIDMNLARELESGDLIDDASIDELEISLGTRASRQSVQSTIQRTPGLVFTNTVEAGDETRLIARFERNSLRAAVEALALDPEVSAIAFRWPVRFNNSQAGWLHQSAINTPNPLTPLFDKGLFGCGQIVGEFDTGIHMAHCSFNDPTQTLAFNKCSTGASCPTIAAPNYNHRKVVAYYKWSGLAGNNPEDNHGHGTHVAGSIAGNNPASAVDCSNFTTPGGKTNLDGTAPGAKIVMQESGGNLAYVNTQGGNPYHAATVAYANGARLHSNSWGGGCVNPITGMCMANCSVTYDSLARDADRVSVDKPDMFVLYAAGNDGTTCAAGNNVGSPGNAKNVLTIGATSRGANANSMAGFSSRGPTLDSRTKPDLTAQGTDIISAGRSACGTATMSGTSMATPTAAGLAALVRDYLARGFYPTGRKVAANAIPNPSAALVKAIMITGAKSMTGIGAGAAPGQAQGWGRVLLDNSLYFEGDSSRLFIHDAPTGLQTGGVGSHALTVAAGQPLNITLAWTDVAAALNASPSIVNRLRLEVTTPGGAVWTQKLPAGVNVNNANPTQGTTTTNYDTLNNVHRIGFATPEAGTYQVRVLGINVPQGTQKYALAATGNFPSSSTPDFSLQATPPSASVCAGSTAQFTIGAASIGGFSSTVNLSVAGVPGGANATFAPASLAPGNPAPSSQLSIATSAAAASGNYTLSIQGASTSPALQRTAQANLIVSAAAPSAGNLQSPADLANDVTQTPTFTWNAIPNAAQYRFQLSADAGFGSLLVNELVTTTSFTPTNALGAGATYYWRVVGINDCGTGAASSVFRFTTADSLCRSPNIAIPDANAIGITDSQTINSGGTLSGLRLSVDVEHTWVGDLKLILSKGSTSVVLVDRPGGTTNFGFGCSGDNMNVRIEDGASRSLATDCGNSPNPGYLSGEAYRPSNPLSAFIGQSLAGTWSLRAIDATGGDTGRLKSWCLLPNASPAAPLDSIFENDFEEAP